VLKAWSLVLKRIKCFGAPQPHRKHQRSGEDECQRQAAPQAVDAQWSFVTEGVADRQLQLGGSQVSKTRPGAPFACSGGIDLAYWSLAVQTAGVDDSTSLLGGSILPGELTYKPTVLSRIV